ncbi:hypothetical protein LBMAG20_18070 [Methylocystaceae bacterium]|nr:hypothetical protein LBMAG20_18070 [Methylocystaceae bacterium]
MVRFAATNIETFHALGMADKIKRTTRKSQFDAYFAQVNTSGSGNVWLASDAAHVHSPIGGCGMNMGIADGLRFAQAIIEDDFKTYQSTSHKIAQSWLAKNKLFTEIMSDNGIKGNIRRLAIRQIFNLLNQIDQEQPARCIFNTIVIG